MGMFALGVTLFEILVGVWPFEENAEKHSRTLFVEDAWPMEFAGDVLKNPEIYNHEARHEHIVDTSSSEETRLWDYHDGFEYRFFATQDTIDGLTVPIPRV